MVEITITGRRLFHWEFFNSQREKHLDSPTKPRAQNEHSIPEDLQNTADAEHVVRQPIRQAAANAPRVQSSKRFPNNLPIDLGISLDQTGKAFAIVPSIRNPCALAVGGRALNNIIREAAQKEGIRLTKFALADINEDLQAHAERSTKVTPVWRRVAPIKGGIEIDSGDEAHTRFVITGDGVRIVRNNSATVFHRPRSAKSMVMPAENGDLKLLRKYVNLDAVSFVLFTAWLTYTLAHPKVDGSKYVILTILGGQGSGKSLLSKVTKELIDPSLVGAQILPANIKDLSIAAQQSHVLCYDNLRSLSHAMADALCVAATGGSMASRQLYSDAEQHVLHLHVALVLNGIHAFIDQPDLAQRCLPLYLEPIEGKQRQSEAEMLQKLAADMPAIQRGLFDSIARTIKHFPSAQVINPERMIDFCKWLAAMEAADGTTPGCYQDLYRDALDEGQLDALLDNPLAAAILEFADELDDDRDWRGTPATLLSRLNDSVTRSTQYCKDWPDNPIALSKRLQSLQAGLSTQGVKIDFGRGKERTISIEKTGSKK